jgi:tetratricopeptide (TPR) repeat protein
MMDKQLDEALTLLRSAAQKRPADPAIRQRLFEACVKSGLCDEAVAEFIGLVKAQPSWPQVQFDTLNRLVPAATMPAIFAAFERAAAVTPANALVWYGLGRACQVVKTDQQGAAEAFRRGIAADPRFAAMHYNLAVALMDRRAEAAEYAHRAVECDPDMAEPHYILGSYYMIRDRAKSEHHFRKFIALAPPHLHSYVGGAQVSLQLLAEMNEHRRAGPSPSKMGWLGRPKG